MERVNETPLNILVIANRDSATDWVRSSLSEWDYGLIGVFDTVSQGLQVVEQTSVDIILADGSAQGVQETDWIQTLTVQSAGTSVIVMAADSEMEFVRQAMLAGAQAFLLKPFDLS